MRSFSSLPEPVGLRTANITVASWATAAGTPLRSVVQEEGGAGFVVLASGRESLLTGWRWSCVGSVKDWQCDVEESGHE
jgi:hypothetical protein